MLNIDAITKDENIVKKLVIGAVLALIGIGMIPLAGWMIEAARKVVQEGDDTLPEWDDWGKYIRDGFKLMGLGLVWTLPILILFIVIAAVGIAAPELFASGDDAAVAIVILNLCVIGITFIYVLPLSLLITAAIPVLADTGSLKAALNPMTSFNYVKANFVGYLVALLISYVVGTVLGMLGTILCLIGIFPAAALNYGVMGQLYGKAHRQAMENLGEIPGQV